MIEEKQCEKEDCILLDTGAGKDRVLSELE